MTIKQNVVEIDRSSNIADPRSGSSLVPMLISGIVMIVVGMFVALAFS